MKHWDQFKEVHMGACDRLMNHGVPWRLGAFERWSALDSNNLS